MTKVKIQIKKVISVVLFVVLAVFFTTALGTNKAHAFTLDFGQPNSSVYTCDENVRAYYSAKCRPVVNEDKTKYRDGSDYVTNINIRTPDLGLNVFYETEIDGLFSDLNVWFTVAAIDKNGQVVARWKDGEWCFWSRTQFIMFRDDDCSYESYDGAKYLIDGPNYKKFDGKFVVETVEVKD